jgi:hypothetical protein
VEALARYFLQLLFSHFQSFVDAAIRYSNRPSNDLHLRKDELEDFAQRYDLP